jgi:hypothetical protein
MGMGGGRSERGEFFWGIVSWMIMSGEKWRVVSSP